MNNAYAVFRHLVSLLAVAVLFGAAPGAAQAAPDDAAVQRVLQQVSRGFGAGHDIQKLGGSAARSHRDTSRGAEARQLAHAQEELVLALRAYQHGSGSVPALVARYDQWQAAAEVVRINAPQERVSAVLAMLLVERSAA